MAKRGEIANAVASLAEMVKSRELGWKFSNGTVLTMNLEQLYTDFVRMPEAAQFMFARGGFEKVRDSYAGLSVSEAIDTATSTISYLLDGKWFKERTAGPRIAELFEAATRALTKAGMPAPSEVEFRAKYADASDAEERRTDLRAMPEIKAELALMAKEAADKKAAEMVAAAGSSTSNLASI